MPKNFDEIKAGELTIVRCEIPLPFLAGKLCRKAHNVGANLKGGGV